MTEKDSHPGSNVPAGDTTGSPQAGSPQAAAPPRQGSDGQTGRALRRRAEEMAREQAGLSSPEDAAQTLHELRVHQIELEMQNEELRRSGAELDAARARYFDLYDLAPVGYVTVSESGLILEANLTAANLLGVARSALDRQPLSLFILPEDQDVYYLHRKHLLETGQTQASELRLMKGDGAPFWARLESTTAQDADDAPVCRFVMSDISELKRVEASLIDISQRNRALLDANPDMFFVFTADGRIVDAKSEHPDDLYVQPAEFLGKRIGEVLPPDLAQRTMEFIAEARRTGRLVQYTYSLELHGKTKDFESRLVPCENGTFMALVRDITERMRAEEALKRTAEELSQANEEALQFAHIVAHDLRAPLVNVGGFVSELRVSLADLERLLQPAVQQLGETDKEYASRVLRQDLPEALGITESSVIRMDTLISALLRLSRVGRHEPVMEPLDLGSMVSGILASLATQIEAHRAAITVLPLPEVTADRATMEQILGNILANAIFYLDPARPGRIEVCGSLAGTDLLMKISDNGRGIARDDRDKVFAPFRRAGVPDVPGEGMGLAYTQTLVRRQGGGIWFDSEPGVGTTFSFTLPVVRP